MRLHVRRYSDRDRVFHSFAVLKKKMNERETCDSRGQKLSKEGQRSENGMGGRRSKVQEVTKQVQ